MKNYIYYDRIKKGFVLEPGDNTVGVTKEKYTNLLNEQSSGKEIFIEGDNVLSRAVYQDLENIERAWRNAELQRSDVELNKVQDSDPKAIGNVSDWRHYRRLLRAWPDDVNFPDNQFRPVSP